MRTALRTCLALGIAAGIAACGPALAPVAARPPPPAGASRAASDDAVAEGFKVLGQRDGVTLFKRDGRPGLELAAEAEFPAPPERVRRVLLDYPAHKSWKKRLAECSVVAKGSNSLHVYERLALPLMQDRDYVLRVTWGDDAGVLWTKYTTDADQGPPPVSGVHRVKVHDGAWRFAPVRGGAATRAFYRFHVDLDTPLATLAGTGPAEAELIEFFQKIRAQLPRYEG